MSTTLERGLRVSGFPTRSRTNPDSFQAASTPLARPSEVSRRRLRVEVAKITTVVRQFAILTAVSIDLLVPTVPGGTHTALMIGLAMWATYRLITKAQSRAAIAGDVVAMLVIGAAIPIVTNAAAFTDKVSLPQAAVGVSIASFGVQLAVAKSLPILLLGVGACVWGAIALVGWDRTLILDNLLPITGGWVGAVLLRQTVARVARTSDQAHRDRLSTEVANGIAEARRNEDREQLALLHDTAAATLLLVGRAVPVPVERLAAQASRDLAVLQARPVDNSSTPVDLVELLRAETAHLHMPISFTGLDHLWLDGVRAGALCAVTREALNNVDRHAGGTSVTIYTGRNRLEIADDGRGFVSGARRGHGVDESIVARMERIGGTARIRSISNVGTTVELQWAETAVEPEVVDLGDELVRQVRSRYGLALIVAAVLLLPVAVWRGPASNELLEIGLAVAAALCALAAVPKIVHGPRVSVWVAAAALAGIAIAQKCTLDSSQVGTYADWSQGLVGFCLLPHLIRVPAARGVAILLSLWTVSSLVDAVRNPSFGVTAYIGMAIAAFLVPQIAACVFSRSVWDALLDAKRENQARLRLETREAVAEALQSECMKRYSGTVDRLVPLLQTLSGGGPITDDLRRQARTECRRLRALFDESGVDTTVLSQQIQTLIGQAEQRGVDVTAHVDDDLPVLRMDTAEHVLSHLGNALERARTWARIVLTTANAKVDLSVICDVSKESHCESQHPPSGVDVVVTGDTMWMTMRAG
jgi:hypothetical protein